jgi:nucleoside phosphorylase
MILVTFALPAESSAFIRSLRNVKRDRAMVCGDLEDQPLQTDHSRSSICVLHTGVGEKECEKRLCNFLRKTQPQLLIASGFCGGTSDDRHPGNLVIAANVSDPELLRKTQAILPGAIVGKIYSADRIVDPAMDRYAIGREQGAIAIDMESATIARICAEKSIPMVGLRVVSDSPAAPFPAPPHILFDVTKQRTDLLRLIAYIARKPASVVVLAKFSKRISIAKATLADALVTVLRRL